MISSLTLIVKRIPFKKIDEVMAQKFEKSLQHFLTCILLTECKQSLCNHVEQSE